MFSASSKIFFFIEIFKMGTIEKDEISRQKLSHDISKRTSLKTHIKRGIVIFTVIKVIMGLQNIIFQKPTFENLANNFTLEDIYDDNKGEFTLLDQQQVKFTMEPNTGCVRGERFVVMALSAPNNEPKREIIRYALFHHSRTMNGKLIFLLLYENHFLGLTFLGGNKGAEKGFIPVSAASLASIDIV